MVQSLNQEDPLEKGMATHPSILAQKIPWTEEPGGQRSIVCGTSEESNMTERTLTYHLSKPFLMAHCVKKLFFQKTFEGLLCHYLSLEISSLWIR